MFALFFLFNLWRTPPAPDLGSCTCAAGFLHWVLLFSRAGMWGGSQVFALLCFGDPDHSSVACSRGRHSGTAGGQSLPLVLPPTSRGQSSCLMLPSGLLGRRDERHSNKTTFTFSSEVESTHSVTILEASGQAGLFQDISRTEETSAPTL